MNWNEFSSAKLLKLSPEKAAAKLQTLSPEEVLALQEQKLRNIGRIVAREIKRLSLSAHDAVLRGEPRETVSAIKTDIAKHDRILKCVAGALQNLPDDPVERFNAFCDHGDAVGRLLQDLA